MALTVATSCFVGCGDDKENNSNGENGICRSTGGRCKQ